MLGGNSNWLVDPLAKNESLDAGPFRVVDVEPRDAPERRIGSRRFWDGAIGGYNNPCVAGVMEALANDAHRANVRVLSIGTGTVRRPRRPSSETGRSTVFDGGEPQSLVGDLKKLAAAILDDPPDAASFVAHVTLGGRMPLEEPVVDGPIVRMNPTIRPEMRDGTWRWPPVFDEGVWNRLVGLDMDAVAAEEVALIAGLCEAWQADKVPNQAIRSGEDLTAEIGHDTYGAAEAAVRRWL